MITAAVRHETQAQWLPRFPPPSWLQAVRHFSNFRKPSMITPSTSGATREARGLVS
jgi:hypothetical protein